MAAGTGLLNPSFEQGSGNSLDNWTLKAYKYSGGDTRTQVYGPGQNPVPCEAGDPYGICVVQGSDTFTPDYGDPVTVPVLDGSKMVRLAGPFKNNGVRQNQDGLVMEQSFTVPNANPVVNLNYNLFTFDYSGFDQVSLKVKLTSPGEPTLTERIQGGFGSGISLKTTGWRNSDLDLSSYVGQTVKLEVELRGTSDSLYGSWAYVDAGVAPEPDVKVPDSEMGAPATTPNGTPVSIHKYVDDGAGQVFFNIPHSQVSQFTNGCMPITIDIPINAGNATVSNVVIRLNGSALPTTSVGGGVYRASIDCASSGMLGVSYTLTEDGVSQDFSVPIGGITLIDPQGVVYDAEAFAAAKQGGKTDEQARAAAAISGASARLQRKVGGEFVNVISGDPGISPNVNPQVTSADGIFQWDVSQGTYRVVVTKAGYPDATSRVVDIPPPVLDLHIAMSKATTPPVVTPPVVTPPVVTPPVVKPPDVRTIPCSKATGKNHTHCLRLLKCQKLSGKKKSACIKLAARRKKCLALKGKKKSACEKKAKALTKCDKLKGKAKKKCKAKAKKAGTGRKK